MLSTKDMSDGSGKIKPVISVGNQKLKINSITFDQTPYDKEAYNMVLHVESEPMKGSFQGFLVNKDDEKGSRYKGQVGRVRVSPYPFKDTTLPSGIEIKRDTEALKNLVFIAKTLGLRDELDVINADDIFEFVESANGILSGNDIYINTCIAGREWENKEGYINYDLFLPRMSKDGIPLENLNVSSEESRLYTFDANKHVQKLKKKVIESFEPSKSNSGDDFDI
jgi:hypothetical protein